MQKKHPLVINWKQNKSTLNGWISLANAFSVEIMASHDFDSLTIDMQHGVSDYTSMLNMLPSIQRNNIQALVRVPWLDPAQIMKTLDAGAGGIICPMINTQEDAQKLVEYSMYAPVGARSFGPIRAKYVYEENYADIANQSILIIAMIETKTAIDNIDDILSVDGIDAIYIGPADLSLSLGATPKFDQDDPIVLENIEYILKKAKEYNKFAGIHNGDVNYALKMTSLGFDFVTVASDAMLIAKGANELVNGFRRQKVQADSSNY